MQARYDAAMLGNRPDLVEGVTPLRVDPDFLITPEGVVSLTGYAGEGPPADGPRTVEFDNGSVGLLGGGH